LEPGLKLIVISMDWHDKCFILIMKNLGGIKCSKES
jgi:hypothetical protein